MVRIACSWLILRDFHSKRTSRFVVLAVRRGALEMVKTAQHALLARKAARLIAPKLVTSLWTGCTSLKTRRINPCAFD
jgi:hypothetical protein